jgi:hypothetical protein
MLPASRSHAHQVRTYIIKRGDRVQRSLPADSGLECLGCLEVPWLLSLLQVLPFRASIAHHDAHHKHCNHALRATNYAEGFWVWDALFGTAGPIRGHAPADQPAKLQ